MPDEMQRATAINVTGDRRTCIRIALASVRTESAPDIGDAQVQAKLAF